MSIFGQRKDTPEEESLPSPGKKVAAEIYAMPRAGDSYAVTEGAVAAVKEFVQEVTNNNDRLAVLGRIDVDRMIALAEQGGADWWFAFNGRVFAGELEGMQKVYDAAAKSGNANDLLSFTSAMTWLSRPLTLDGDYASNIKPEAFRQLIEWGADPSFNGESHFLDALRNLGSECIKVLVDAGAKPDTVFSVMAQLRAEGNTEQAKRIEASVKGKTLDYKIDDQMLLRAKLLPDALGVSTLKTIFNFRAASVTEIYEYGADRSAVPTTATFDQYDPEAVASARERLETLGGKPRKVLRKIALKRPEP